ncbi:MAG: flagellar motor protein MotB [Lachnospiraceae bacterium]|nr:flagellar motor protein MotB [Lachnospiraceae bacterium]HCJ06867.1 chemotaxis protein [Lachnospiraceae bacterium]
MAKRREKPPEEGSPAWMATFSDLMNLLLCFFVLLFASSTVDEEKIQRIMASFNDASFSILDSGSVSLVDGQIVSGGVTQLPGIESVLEYIGVSSEVKGNNQDLSATGADDGKEDSSNQPDSVQPSSEEVIEDNQTSSMSQQNLMEQLEQEGMKQSEQMYDEISEKVESYKIEDNISMDYNSQYVLLDLNGALLFDQGKADLREDAEAFMKKVTSILKRYKECVVEIEGHTDNVPIHSSVYQSNRYLSTARATKVYEYIMDNSDLIDSNLKVAGYGESRPVASNDTEEGRAKNRRVTIKIYNQLNSDLQQESAQ